MASFNVINYSLRVNKNVERKLIFDAFLKLQNALEVGRYRYIGLGSIWFVDFIIAHKVLNVDEMISMEQDAEGVARARFNRPFRNIVIEHGESSNIIPKVHWDSGPVIAWLDYDRSLARSSALQDIGLLCSRASSRSIVAVTVNADIRQLEPYITSNQDALKRIKEVLENDAVSESDKLAVIEEAAKSAGESVQQQRLAAIESIAGDLLPLELPLSALNRSSFPQLVARILLNQFHHSMVESGRTQSFYPLFNFYYQDNAPMVTVGGVIVDETDVWKIEESNIIGNDHIRGEEQVTIRLPLLTVKEKLALDRLLPREDSLAPALVTEDSNITLKAEELEAYQSFYKHYPVYLEVDF